MAMAELRELHSPIKNPFDSRNQGSKARTQMIQTNLQKLHELAHPQQPEEAKPEKTQRPGTSSRKVAANVAQAASAAVMLNAAAAGIQSVSAEGTSTPTPVSSPGHELFMETGMPSEQAYRSTVQEAPTPTSSPRPETPTPTPTAEVKNEVKNKEVKIQQIQNPIEFTYNAKWYGWFFSNARYGIPPNDENARTGTVDVYKNGNFDPANYDYSFQPLRSLDPEADDGRFVGTAGQIADIQTGKGYMVRVITYDDINGVTLYKISIESIADIANPTDYSNGARKLMKEGLEDLLTDGWGIDSFYMTEDAEGKCLNFTTTHARDSAGNPDPTKNGTYQIRLDAKGEPIPPAQKLGAEVTPTPTPTKTPTPTVTATVTRMTNWVGRVLLPWMTKSVSGGW